MLVTQPFLTQRFAGMATLESYLAWRAKNVFIPANVAWSDIGMASIHDPEPAPPPVKLRRHGWRVGENIKRARKVNR